MAKTKKTIKNQKSKDKKRKPDSKKNNFDHEFSFNLLTEPWLPVIDLNGKKKFLSLIDFLETAHQLERFDFPLPGLETAVLRFLVAIVHIVGAPKDKSEWETWFKNGKFEKKFIAELQIYKNKLDLFSKTEPFLQEFSFKDQKEKPVAKLIDVFPSGNNSTHFGSLDLKRGLDLVYIHPSMAFPVLLYCFMGALAGLDGDGGLNGGATPYYLSIHSNNLFKTVLLNVLDIEYISNTLSFKNKCKKPEGKWLTKFSDKTSRNKISIQDSLLWKSRSVKLVPQKVEDKVCSISGLQIQKLGIKEIFYTKQKVSLTDFWEDFQNSIVEKPKDKKKPIQKLKPFGDLPAWKDYPTLILSEKKQEGSIFSQPPIVLTRFLNQSLKEKKIFLSVLGVITNKAKVLRISENKFPFKPDFIENDEISSKIKLLVEKTRKYEGRILSSLLMAFNLIKKMEKMKPKQAMKIRNSIQSLFQSAYWHELGSAFENSLERLAESDKYADEVLSDWKKMLAGHIRATFKRHTEKLIYNPKNLKAYENGRRFLENAIFNDLLKEKA